MTLALDSTALVARYVAGPHRRVLLDAMADDPDWCASSLALSEGIVLVERMADPAQAVNLRRALLDDWRRITAVPVDQLCLERAAELGRAHPLRTIDAIHLAAADRLPRPVRFATLDAHQLAVAEVLGFEIVATTTR